MTKKRELPPPKGELPSWLKVVLFVILVEGGIALFIYLLTLML